MKAELLETDPAAALTHAKSLPPALASKVINQTFRERFSLLEADQAIEFLRQALNRSNHEALVGMVCGQQPSSKGADGLRTFFRDHDATLGEREAIILQAVEMETHMNLNARTREFIERIRAFAKEEGPGVVDDATGIIIGNVSDRPQDDKVAVDMILEFDLKGTAIQAFCKERGTSTFDEKQRERIADRIDP